VQEGVYPPPFLEDLKALAREEGLWNLFLPTLRADEPGTRLSNLDYAPLAEVMGRLPWAAEVFNCSAPDTGNMELLHRLPTMRSGRNGCSRCCTATSARPLPCQSPTWPPATPPTCRPRCAARVSTWWSVAASGSSPARRTRIASC
jgi:hypothetical protein